MTNPHENTLPLTPAAKPATTAESNNAEPQNTQAAPPKGNITRFDEKTLALNDDASVSLERTKAVSERRYEVGSEIARGGMGIVYRATDTTLDRVVAIKVLRSPYPSNSSIGRRFIDEARVMADLQHPGIPPVHDLGTLPDGRHFLAMKLVMGQTFDALLAARNSPESDLGRFLVSFEQICNAVAFAHSHRIIHRDLKPANVMVGEFGEVQVMDWGLAKVLEAAHSNRGTSDPSPPPVEARDARTIAGIETTEDERTQYGVVLGTPQYMPPEQAGGAADEVDERSDVFGLGGILCVILTGRPPYVAPTGESLWQLTVGAQTSDAIARLESSPCDAELVALCKRCLSVNPHDRPANASEVALAIRAFRDASELRAQKAQVERWKAEATLRHQTKLRRVQLALAGVVALLLLGAMGAAWMQQHQQARIANAELQRNLESELQQAQELAAEDRRNAEILAILDRVEALLREDRPGAAASASLLLDSADQRASEGGSNVHANRLAALRNDARLLKELDAVNAYRWTSSGGNFPAARQVGERFHQALIRFGFDPDTSSHEETAKKISQSAARDRIVLALDRMRPSSGALAVLELVDATPYRSAMRQALWHADVARVTELMEAPEAAEQPPAFVAVLGDQASLPPDRRRALLLAAVRKRPDDMGLLFILGALGANSDDAIRWFQAAVAVNPRVAATHHNLGNVLRDKGDLPGAIAAFRDAAAVDPTDANVQNNLGHAFHLSGNFDEAMKHYRESIRLDPNLPHPHANLGSAFGMLGKREEAIQELREAVRLDPSLPQPLLNLGNALRGIDDLDGATTAFRKALELNPNYAQAHCNLGRALMQQGKLDEALEHLKRGHELGSARPGWRYPSATWIAECEQLISAAKK